MEGHKAWIARLEKELVEAVKMNQALITCLRSIEAAAIAHSDGVRTITAQFLKKIDKK